MMLEQVGYRRSTMLTWLLLRRVRVCRILVPEGTATRRNIPVEGSGSSDTLLSYAWASWLSPIDDAHVASSSTSTSVQALLSAHTSGGVNRDGQLLSVDQWPCRVVGEKRDHATCKWSLLLTVDWVSTVGDWALRGLQLICIAIWRIALTVHGEELTKWRRWCTTSLPAVTSLLLCNHFLGRTHLSPRQSESETSSFSS